MTLGQRLKEVKLTLEKPYHLFAKTSNGKIVLYLEGTDKSKLEFSGNSIADVLETAETYIDHEKKMGSLRSKREETENEKTLQ